MRRWAVVGIAIAAAGLLSGCSKDKETANQGKPEEPRPRGIGQFSEDRGPAATQPEGMTGPTEPGPAATMPNDAIHAQLRAPGADIAPKFTPPPDWQPRPARPMVQEVYAVPKAEGDTEDAELTISFIDRHVPLKTNVVRWCGQFGLSPQDCDKAAKTEKLEGTKFPTTVVEISGTYQPSGGMMMAPTGPPKPNYRMLAAELRAPQRPYFVKLVGPEKTVEKWREAFMTFVKEAK